MSQSPAATKKCPECASMVPAEARKCANCGHAFVHRSTIAAPIVLFLAIVLVASALFGDYAGPIFAGALVLGSAFLIIRSARKASQDRDKKSQSMEQSD